MGRIRLSQVIDLAAQTVSGAGSEGAMHYSLLVGADGASSVVREAMQAQVRQPPVCTLPRRGTRASAWRPGCPQPGERGELESTLSRLQEAIGFATCCSCSDTQLLRYGEDCRGRSEPTAGLPQVVGMETHKTVSDLTFTIIRGLPAADLNPPGALGSLPSACALPLSHEDVPMRAGGEGRPQNLIAYPIEFRQAHWVYT